MGDLILSTIIVTVGDKRIGKKLKQARVDAGLSQEQVAQKLGVTWEMISRYENGRTSALKRIEKFAEVYEKPISYFVDTDEYDSFSVDTIVNKLKEEIDFQSNTPRLVKLVRKFTGAGVEEDLDDSDYLYEVPNRIFDKYTNLFALEFGGISLDEELSMNPGEIGIFALQLEAKKGDVVLGYDGMDYKIMQFDPNSDFADLAVLVQLERKFR